MYNILKNANQNSNKYNPNLIQVTELIDSFVLDHTTNETPSTNVTPIYTRLESIHVDTSTPADDPVDDHSVSFGYDMLPFSDGMIESLALLKEVVIDSDDSSYSEDQAPLTEVLVDDVGSTKIPAHSKEPANSLSLMEPFTVDYENYLIPGRFSVRFTVGFDLDKSSHLVLQHLYEKCKFYDIDTKYWYLVQTGNSTNKYVSHIYYNIQSDDSTMTFKMYYILYILRHILAELYVEPIPAGLPSTRFFGEIHLIHGMWIFN